MPALEPYYIIEPIFEQFEALLPERRPNHPLGPHRPRIPAGVVFGKPVEVLVFGCAYRSHRRWLLLAESTLRVAEARGVDRSRADGEAQGNLPRNLRAPHRPRTGRSGGGRMYNRGSSRRGESGKEPGGSRKRRRRTLDGGGSERHPSRERHRPGRSSRLAALGGDPRRLGATPRRELSAGSSERASGPRAYD
jgi:hypothetical protein